MGTWTHCPLEDLRWAAEELSEDRASDVTEKVVVDKDEDVTEEVDLQNLMLKQLWENFHSIESIKDHILETDPDLVRYAILHRGIDKTLSPYEK